MAGLGRPELRAAGRLVARVEQLERAQDALPVVRGDLRRDLRVALEQVGVQRAHALVGEPPGVALADRGVRRRPQVELGERGAQVEPGAADDDRAPALLDQRVDLGVRAARVVAGGGARA